MKKNFLSLLLIVVCGGFLLIGFRSALTEVGGSVYYTQGVIWGSLVLGQWFFDFESFERFVWWNPWGIMGVRFLQGLIFINLIICLFVMSLLQFLDFFKGIIGFAFIFILFLQIYGQIKAFIRSR